MIETITTLLLGLAKLIKTLMDALPFGPVINILLVSIGGGYAIKYFVTKAEKPLIWLWVIASLLIFIFLTFSGGN